MKFIKYLLILLLLVTFSSLVSATVLYSEDFSTNKTNDFVSFGEAGTGADTFTWHQTPENASVQQFSGGQDSLIDMSQNYSLNPMTEAFTFSGRLQEFDRTATTSAGVWYHGITNNTRGGGFTTGNPTSILVQITWQKTANGNDKSMQMNLVGDNGASDTVCEAFNTGDNPSPQHTNNNWTLNGYGNGTFRLQITSNRDGTNSCYITTVIQDYNTSFKHFFIGSNNDGAGVWFKSYFDDILIETPSAGGTAPSVNLLSPGDNTDSFNPNINYVANVTNSTTLGNCSIYTNRSGSWVLNQTLDNATGAGANVTFSAVGLSQDTIWNVECCNSDDITCAFASANFTVLANKSAPLINLINATGSINYTSEGGSIFGYNGTVWKNLTISDSTPTITFTTDVFANYRFDSTAGNWSDMNTTMVCSTTGSTTHTCTLWNALTKSAATQLWVAGCSVMDINACTSGEDVTIS